MTKMSKIETERGMNIIKELIEILKDSEQNKNIWLNIKKVPGPFKLKSSKLTEMTQKKAYKIVLRHRKNSLVTTQQIRKWKALEKNYFKKQELAQLLVKYGQIMKKK